MEGAADERAYLRIQAKAERRIQMPGTAKSTEEKRRESWSIENLENPYRDASGRRRGSGSFVIWSEGEKGEEETKGLKVKEE